MRHRKGRLFLCAQNEKAVICCMKKEEESHYLILPDTREKKKSCHFFVGWGTERPPYLALDEAQKDHHTLRWMKHRKATIPCVGWSTERPPYLALDEEQKDHHTLHWMRNRKTTIPCVGWGTERPPYLLLLLWILVYIWVSLHWGQPAVPHTAVPASLCPVCSAVLCFLANVKFESYWRSTQCVAIESSR